VTQGTPVCGGMHGDQCTFPVSGTVQSYAPSPPTLTVIRDHGSLPFTKVPTAIARAPTFILVVTGGGEHDPGQPAPNHGTFVKNIDTLVDTTLVHGSELQWVDGPTLIKGMPPVWLDPTDTPGYSPIPIIPDDNIPGWPIIKSQDGKSLVGRL